MNFKTFMITMVILVTLFIGYKWYKSHKGNLCISDGKPSVTPQNKPSLPTTREEAYAYDFEAQADITLEEARNLVREADKSYVLCDSEMLEGLEQDPNQFWKTSPSLYILSVRKEGQTSETWYKISKNTFDKLVEDGVEPDYN